MLEGTGFDRIVRATVEFRFHAAVFRFLTCKGIDEEQSGKFQGLRRKYGHGSCTPDF